MKYVQAFRIDFNLLSIKKYKVTIPFHIVFQTDSTNIEKHCKEKWPELLIAHSFSEDELMLLLEMKQYIRSHLSANDSNEINNYFYEKGWMNAVEKSWGVSKVEFITYMASMWTDKFYPHLEIDGTITLELDKMLDLYIKKQYFTFKYDKRFVSEDIEIYFQRSMPLLITYLESTKIKFLVLEYMKENIKSFTSLLYKELYRLTKIKGIEKYKKEITWKDPQRILIHINDFFKLLKLKASENKIPLTIGGFAAFYLLQNPKKDKKYFGE